MTGLVRKAALLGACGLFMASIAGAAVPDPSHSSMAGGGPFWIDMGGARATSGPNAGLPDPGIAFTVTVRDFLNNPIGGSTVEFNYALCTDSWLCQAIVAGQNVDCTSEAVRVTTNAAGQATVSVLGGSKHPGVNPPAVWPGANTSCIRVYADGIQIGQAYSVIYNLNGALDGSGVNAGDVPLLRNDVGAYSANTANYKARSDFNHDLAVNAVDLGAFAAGGGSIIGRSNAGNGSLAGCWGNGPSGVAVPQIYCP